MSQEKVDRYKESKKNRKKELKTAKRKKLLSRAIVIVVCAFVVGWLGYSGYHVYEKNKPVVKTDVNLDSIQNYLNNLTTSDAES